MAQNFLYMFEFVVDDILITRPNNCAPEEYPICVEITFRKNVFVSTCYPDLGTNPDPCATKCGKTIVFSLSAPVTAKERIHIHIYKKKTDKCKFLVGATDFYAKPLFDKVTESFNIENPDWIEQLVKHTEHMPDPKQGQKPRAVDNTDIVLGRQEQFAQTFEFSKRLLPFFNMKGAQAGSIVLIMRLVCNGPTIVGSFIYGDRCPPVCRRSKTDTAKSNALGNGEPCAMPDSGKTDDESKCRNFNRKSSEGDFPSCCDDSPKKKKIKSQNSACRTACSNSCSLDQTSFKKSESKCCSQCAANGLDKNSQSINDERKAAKARVLRKLQHLLQKYSQDN